MNLVGLAVAVEVEGEALAGQLRCRAGEIEDQRVFLGARGVAEFQACLTAEGKTPVDPFCGKEYLKW